MGAGAHGRRKFYQCSRRVAPECTITRRFRGVRTRILALVSTILVTGGAGYIGSHACKALARRGHRPVVYDNLSRGHEWAVKWGPLEKGELVDHERLEAVLRAHRPAAVMHFAALAYVGESVAEPARYYSANVVGTLTLLEAMRAQGVARMVLSSSCSLYGRGQTQPIPESAPLVPVSPYGFTKLASERLLQDCCQAYGFAGTALRYFNAAGADPDGEIGEVHDPETHFIPNLLETAAGRKDVMQLFGDDYPTRDGTCVRDYIHVTDLAAAHVAALERPQTAGEFIALNLGTGRGHSLKEILKLAEQVTGRTIRHEVAPRRAGDPPYAVADASRAQRELGWTPRHSTMDEILRTAWAWHARSAEAA